MFKHDPRCVRCGHEFADDHAVMRKGSRFCSFACEQAHEQEAEAFREKHGYSHQETTIADLLRFR